MCECEGMCGEGVGGCVCADVSVCVRLAEGRA